MKEMIKSLQDMIGCCVRSKIILESTEKVSEPTGLITSEIKKCWKTYLSRSIYSYIASCIPLVLDVNPFFFKHSSKSFKSFWGIVIAILVIFVTSIVILIKLQIIYNT
ncbi:MAG TPA: hypothetical protein GXZ72_06635 [Methanobacterium sp.]|uniref:hypothetical protein n=1 Tax=Methanobacterium sp. MZD130B TaxID=3394378 RepID=UPI0017759E7C|nr:hypothetical protein [Methanobacterium sp.]